MKSKEEMQKRKSKGEIQRGNPKGITKEEMQKRKSKEEI